MTWQMKSTRGEKHPLSKLTDKQRDVIKHSKKPTKELAAEYGVSKVTINTIKRLWVSSHLR